ncbi:Glyoxylate/hydroxypyruvate reductase A, partial [Stegodyphus mimosarum]
MLKRNGSRVIAYVRTVRSSSTDSYDEATTNLNKVLEEVDYLCNVLPSTDETRGLLDDDVLKNCKKKPVFINIGRGDIISESNIIKALKEEWISKAILDVFETEPLPPSSPLWQTPEVYITPHVGAIPRIDGIAKFIAQNYVRYVNGEPLMNHIEWNKGY